MMTQAIKITKQPTNVEPVVRLTHIDMDGYRSCVSSSFNPHLELSALIGINGAGKTNLLSAIRLLSLHSNRYGRQTAEVKAASETVVTAWFSVGVLKIGLRLEIRLTESNRNTDEVIQIIETWNLQAITGVKSWKKMPPMELFTKEGEPPLRFMREMLFLESEAKLNPSAKKMYTEAFDFDKELIDNPKVIKTLKLISQFRNGIAYYSASQFTDPTRCPSSFEIDEDSRLSDAYGVSKVHLKFIHDLYALRTSNPDLYAEYEKFISRQHLGLVSRITWKAIVLSSNTADVKSGGTIKKIRKTKTLVIPKIQIGSGYITFNQLSEGTFKTLALVFYVMTDASRCLLIEEPEVCVHHGLLSRIIDTIKAYSKYKQVIFSTHSDLLLDSLKPDNIHVVEMLRGGTKVTALDSWVGARGRAALHTYLEESGTLGEYWRSGGLS